MSIQMIHYLVTHGWHVWSEVHFYFADHARGCWREWLVSR
jgi:hypothetical protein